MKKKKDKKDDIDTGDAPDMPNGRGEKTQRRSRIEPGSGFTSRIDDSVQAVLTGHDILVDAVDERTVRLGGVPLSAEFNKAKTNLLLHGSASRPVSFQAYVDADLLYHGSDRKLRRALLGDCRRDWRRLLVRIEHEDVNFALHEVLEHLDSPIADQVRRVLPRASLESQELDPALQAVGHIVSPETAEDAYTRTFRKELADQLSVTVTRPDSPCGVILWARSGAGRNLLMLSAAHRLLEERRVEQVVQISGSAIAAGSIFPAEKDASLLHTLRAARRRAATVFLIRDIDLAVSGTDAGLAILCDAIDMGVRFLATVRSERGLSQIASDEALARRVVAVDLGEPTRRVVAQVLEEIARTSPCEVTPAAINVILHLSETRAVDGVEPARSVGLLTAAIHRASYLGGQVVDPDMIFAVQSSRWPEDIKEN